METVKSALFGISIAILLPLFMVYTSELLYESPEYSDFCGMDVPRPMLEKANITQAECEAEGGKFYQSYCDFEYSCRAGFEEASSRHGKVVFVALIIAGLAVFSTGILVSKLAISAGIMAGSTITIFYASTAFWRYATPALRVIMLGAALLIMICLAYRKNGRMLAKPGKKIKK